MTFSHNSKETFIDFLEELLKNVKIEKCAAVMMINKSNQLNFMDCVITFTEFLSFWLHYFV